MRMPVGSSPVSRTPRTPRSYVSPTSAGSSAGSTNWREKLKRRNRTSSLWSVEPPLFQKEAAERWCYEDTEAANDSIYGSKASIDYLSSEDDIARRAYQNSRWGEAQTRNIYGRWDAGRRGKTTRSDRPMGKQERLSGYNFASMLIGEELHRR